MSGEQRRAVLGALDGSRVGSTVAELALRLDVHPNTIRFHLDVLMRSGLVQPGLPAPRGGRGRPSVRYRLTGEGAAFLHRPAAELLRVLADELARDRSGPERAYAAGRRWGRELSRNAPALSVVDLLDKHGFEATESNDVIELHSCPFADVAKSSPEIVCTLHRGMIDGALEQAGDARAVDGLRPFARPGVCVAALR